MHPIQKTGLKIGENTQLKELGFLRKKQKLDKPAEKVILIKEKKPATKKKSRAKKTTSK
jgi:hypothetical protein